MDQHDVAGKILFVFIHVVVDRRNERLVVAEMMAGWGSTGRLVPFAKMFDELGERDKGAI